MQSHEPIKPAAQVMHATFDDEAMLSTWPGRRRFQLHLQMRERLTGVVNGGLGMTK